MEGLCHADEMVLSFQKLLEVLVEKDKENLEIFF